jgi:hypothetical protein
MSLFYLEICYVTTQVTPTMSSLRGCMCQGAQFILSYGAKHVAFKTMMISNVDGIDGTPPQFMMVRSMDLRPMQLTLVAIQIL